MFIALKWLIMLKTKKYGVVVKDLNLQNEGESFKSLHLQLRIA
jgi:hypothetical protein